MSILSVYFVTTEACADRDAALDTMFALATHLEDRYRDDAIHGFESAVVATDDDYLEHDLTDQRPAIERVLGDRRPFIWVNLSLSPPGELAPIADLAARYKLVELVTAAAAG